MGNNRLLSGRAMYLIVILVLTTLVLTAIVAGVACTPVPATVAKQPDQVESPYKGPQYDPNSFGVMKYTIAQRAAEEEVYKRMPEALIDKELVQQIESSKAGSTLNLLPHISYNAVQRNQGACGDCWVWSATGVMEVALDIQNGIKDRLSIQYFNSTYNNGTGSASSFPNSFACCGGNAEYFVNHYGQTLHKAIPWSNTNAAWGDGSRCCAGTTGCTSPNTAVPVSSINTTPNYPITSITYGVLPTHTAVASTAIANIKSYLMQKKAVVFMLMFPTSTQLTNFRNFWNGEPQYNLLPYDAAHFGCNVLQVDPSGHGVVCVGWDDRDPNNAYWNMLNSWSDGNPGTHNRPNGLFRVPMNYDYSCKDGNGQYNTWWIAIPVVFSTPYIACDSSQGCNCIGQAGAMPYAATKCDIRPCGVDPTGTTFKYCYRKMEPLPITGQVQSPGYRKIDFFTANSQQVSAGEQVILNWGITGEGNAYLTCGGEKRAVPLTGSVTVTPPQSGCCTLSITNGENVEEKSVCITVVQQQATPPVINSFTASCPRASAVASACTLSWSVSGPAGTTVTISGIGSVGLNGSTQVKPGSYTLTATSAGGSTSRTVQAQ